MDPLAHTLVGACLAETGLRRRTRLATPALIVGANLPDVDVVARYVDADTMYGFRRGHTHGVLAMLVLPCALTALLLLYARLRPGGANAPPLRARWLLALSPLGVITHPLLDWLNTYGVLAAERITTAAPAVPINDGPLARAALTAPEIAGYAHWLRLPAFSLEPRDGGTRVWIRDVRYSRAPTSVGNAWVDLDGHGRPIGSSL